MRTMSPPRIPQGSVATHRRTGRLPGGGGGAAAPLKIFRQLNRFGQLTGKRPWDNLSEVLWANDSPHPSPLSPHPDSRGKKLPTRAT